MTVCNHIERGTRLHTGINPVAHGDTATGTFGNRRPVVGVGEVPIVPPMPAIAEAVYQSTGVRFRELTLNPPKIVAGLAET